MSHTVIITTPPPASGGGSLVAQDTGATGSINWQPSHDLTPDQQQRRIDWAQRKLDEIRARLNAPATHPDE